MNLQKGILRKRLNFSEKKTSQQKGRIVEYNARFHHVSIKLGRSYEEEKRKREKKL